MINSVFTICIGLSGSVTKLNKLNNCADHRKEMDNYNSDEFNDNQELTSLYLNDNLNHNLNDHYSTFDYQPDRTIQNLLMNSNLSMITPQPYSKNVRSVPRKLFFGKESFDKVGINLANGHQLVETSKDQRSTQTKSESSSKILTPPPMPNFNSFSNLKSNSLNKHSDTPDKSKSSLQSSNSFKEDNTRSYLVSDLKKASVNSSSSNLSKINLSDCHGSLMDEIRAFGRNSLKKV